MIDREGKPYEKETGRPAAPPVPEVRPEALRCLLEANLRSVLEGNPRRRDGRGYVPSEREALRLTRCSEIKAWARYLRQEVDQIVWEQERREAIAGLLVRNWGHQGQRRLAGVMAELPDDVRFKIDALLDEKYPGPEPSL